MSTGMDDTVHIEVEVVDSWVVFFDFLGDCLFVLLFLEVVGSLL
jgi:hypothetical protein